MERLRQRKVELLIYEPGICEKEFFSYKVEHDFETFTQKSRVIVANRMEKQLNSVMEKVYTRD